jgi:hypothetical protein
MIKGSLIKDKDIIIIKKFFLKKTFNLEKKIGWDELDNAVFKITNIRKYEHFRNDYKNFTKRYVYEFDIIVDMKYEGYAGSTKYNQRNTRKANGYYRRFVDMSINNELKYFGLSDLDSIFVKKIVWDYL